MEIRLPSRQCTVSRRSTCSGHPQILWLLRTSQLVELHVVVAWFLASSLQISTSTSASSSILRRDAATRVTYELTFSSVNWILCVSRTREIPYSDRLQRPLNSSVLSAVFRYIGLCCSVFLLRRFRVFCNRLVDWNYRVLRSAPDICSIHLDSIISWSQLKFWRWSRHR